MGMQEVKVMAEVASTKDDEKKKTEFDKWEVESAADTLLRAEEIKQNPALMKEVLKKVQAKQKAYTSVSQLKAKRQELSKGTSDDESDSE